jgi:hypothetical protein
MCGGKGAGDCFFTTKKHEKTRKNTIFLGVVALTDEPACENYAMSLFIVEKRWRKSRSRLCESV